MSLMDERKIGNLIKDIAETGHRPVLLRGIVEAYDDIEATCTVRLTSDETGAPTENVLMNVKTQNTLGIWLQPYIGCVAIVGEVESPGVYEVLKFDRLDHVIITGESNVTLKRGPLLVRMFTDQLSIENGDRKLTFEGGVIRFHDGSNNGLVKVDDLVTKLNNLEHKVNDLVTVFSGWTPVANDGGAALKTAAATWFFWKILYSHKHKKRRGFIIGS